MILDILNQGLLWPSTRVNISLYFVLPAHHEVILAVSLPYCVDLEVNEQKTKAGFPHGLATLNVI